MTPSDAGLDGRVALVTGGASGIGAVEARLLTAAGARVLIADIDEERGHLLVDEIRDCGGDARFLRLDVSSASDIDGASSFIADSYGRLDVLVCNVGIAGPTAELVDVSLDEWNYVVTVNLTSVFLLCKAAIPQMRRHGSGRIVILGSVSGKSPLPLRAPYASTKLALVGLVRSLAHEVGRDGITVNVVSPFDVEGSRLDKVLRAAAAKRNVREEQLRRREIEQTAIGRLVRPEDVAQLVLFLCSHAADAITGQDLNVAAGAVMY